MYGSNEVKFCKQCSTLLDTLHTDSQFYAKAAVLLSKTMGKLAKPEYDQMRTTVEAARIKAENARFALLDHRREHTPIQGGPTAADNARNE